MNQEYIDPSTDWAGMANRLYRAAIRGLRSILSFGSVVRNPNALRLEIERFRFLAHHPTIQWLGENVLSMEEFYGHELHQGRDLIAVMVVGEFETRVVTFEPTRSSASKPVGDLYRKDEGFYVMRFHVRDGVMNWCQITDADLINPYEPVTGFEATHTDTMRAVINDHTYSAMIAPN